MQHKSITADPETVQISETYSAMRVVDHDDLESYIYPSSNFQIIKEYGADTSSPRFMVGKVRADELAETTKRVTELRRQLHEASCEITNLKGKVLQCNGDTKYHRETAQLYIDRVGDRDTENNRLIRRMDEFETHIGILRAEVGAPRCIELLGK